MNDGTAQQTKQTVRTLDGAEPPAWLTSRRASAVERAEVLPFDDAEYRTRVQRVREAMAAAEVDAVLVFRPSSVEYLSGFHTAETIPQPLLVTASEMCLMVPDFEVGRALASSWVTDVRCFRYATAHRALSAIAQQVAELVPGSARVGIEVEHQGTPPRVVELLREAGVRVVPGNALVERVRLVLSPAEIRCVEQAAVHTQWGVDAAIEAATVEGTTDSALAAAIAAALRREANSVSAWGPTVATGARAGVPHSTSAAVPLADATFIEFSGAHHRYHAPVMRTLCRGEPAVEVRKLGELAGAALDAVLAAARPGVPCADVARQALAAVGPLPEGVVFHELFGYPVGLAHPPHWMDGAPFSITVDNQEPLEAGMVFHMPGSFRSFGEAGVGLSQTFVVEQSGTRVLTHGVAELIEL